MQSQNIIKRISNLSLIILFISCNNQNIQKTIPKVDSKEKYVYNATNKIEKDSILKVKSKDDYGLLVLKRDYSKEDTITIYNSNGSRWKSFKFDDFFSDNEINPYTMKAENNLLVFKCLKTEKKYFKIIVDEDKQNAKYIKQSDSNFKYETLAEHIISVPFVGFDNEKNPLYQEPDSKSKQLLFNINEDYHPVKTKGDWLMIEDSNNQDYWIKWRDNNGKLILELFYDA
ncbi:hypothetical protein NTJ12_002314 [Flavobacterium psychrophilum]|nr:hypothetical protein [Flavobacterium psychrophilum]